MKSTSDDESICRWMGFGKATALAEELLGSPAARALSIVLALIVFCASAVADDAGITLFESKIRPLLLEHCIGCHGSEQQEGGLRLDSRAGWQQGGGSGAAIVPGKPDESLLIKAVSYLDYTF